MAQTRKQLVAALALLAASTLVTACSDKGPTAAEAGERLNKDIGAMLKEINARNIRFANDGSRDISCGDGKAKREYMVTATKSIPGGTRDMLVSLMVGSITSDYEIVKVDDRSPLTVMRNKSAHATVRLSALDQSTLTVSGSTECLRKG